MSLLAKTVSEDFWIVEQEGNKIGTLQRQLGEYCLNRGYMQEKFSSIKNLQEKYDIEFVTYAMPKVKREMEIYDYPCKSKPYNVMYDVRKKLPLFTKSEKSKSFYCAGHYAVKFENIGWVKSFCPKLITVSRYETYGPFKTKDELAEFMRTVQ